MLWIVLLLELLAILWIFFVARGWELRLIRGENIPRGRLSVYLRFIRPQHWIFFSVLFVFVAHPGFHPSLVLVLPAVFFQQAFLFAMNDYWDKDVDAQNGLKKRRNVVSSGELPLSEAHVLLTLLLFVGALFPLFLGWRPTLLSIGFLVTSYAYSAPPFRLKGRVYWDLISHAFLVFSYPFLFTTVALGTFSLRNMIMYLIFVMLSLQLQISQEVRDFHDDAQIETNTALALGYKKAYLLMSVLLILSCILTFWLVLSEQTSVFFLLVASLCAFVLYDVYRTWKGKDHSACFQNIWWRSNKKVLVGFGPVLLWWLIHV